MKKSFLLCLMLVSCIAKGGGFSINTQGTKSAGMAGYATAMAMDACAVFSNPAAIRSLEQGTLSGGFSVRFPKTSYLNPFDGNEDMESPVSIPFQVAAVIKYGEKMSFGLGLYTPFSQNTKWKDNWSGRYISIENRFKTLFLQPVFAYSINDNFSVGAGPVLGWAAMKNTKAIDVQSASTAYGKEELKGNATSFGFVAGLHFNQNNFSAGVTYRSAMKFKMEGDATYSDIPGGFAVLEDIPSSTTFSKEISTPSSIEAGIAIKFGEKVEVIANVALVQWSVSDSSEIIFGDHPSLNRTEIYNYDDALTYSLAGQFHYNERTWFRAGVSLSDTQVPDGYLSPAFPDADKFIYSGGASYKWKHGITYDASITVRDYKSRIESQNIPYNFNGEYKSTLYIIGLGINYEF